MKKYILLILFFGHLHAQQTRINMGPNINDPKVTDCYPNITPDGKTLYFSRQVNGNYDIYVSHLQNDGSWSLAEPLKELNNEKNNYVFYIYPDGNSLLINGAYPNEGICKTTLTKEGWSKPEYLEFEKTIERWDNHNPKLSRDGKVMVLSFNRDIQVSFLQPNGKWSYPEKIENLSTNTDEFTPFLAGDDKTLYFSSGGFGASYQDIFMTKRLDETWRNWSKPENLGSPVNTSDWETFFVMPVKGSYSFVYSLKEGNGDIFMIKIADEMKPEPVMVINGKVLNKKNNQPIEAEVIYEDLSGKKLPLISKTHPQNGSYKMVLSAGIKYGISAKAEGFLPISENLDLTQLSEYQEKEVILYLTPIEKGQSITLNNIFFDTGKFDLKKESEAELNRLVEILLKNTQLKIEISGHTDGRGNEQANMTLSQNRANSVVNYLISRGISKDRLTAKGYGPHKPIADNQSEEGRQKNRRVEFKILEN